MEKVTVGVAARISGYNRSRITVLASSGKIPNVEIVGANQWLIPRDWAELQGERKRARSRNLSIATAAKTAGVSRNAIYKALARGELTGTQQKHATETSRIRWSVNKDSLNKYIARRTAK